MHSYLRAVGFSEIKTRKLLENIYVSSLKNPNRKMITTTGIDTSLIQFEKDFGANMGLTLVGEYDINGSLSIEHYFPYIKGDVFMEFENISIEKQTDKESYAGVCEDYRLGMTLIFYVLNISDYAKSKWLNYSNRNLSRVKLSGLSTGGTILLGVMQDESSRLYEEKLKRRRNNLLAQAREGNTEAIENLTLEEMDTYATLSGRVHYEDILTIVDTSFMPCGVECDHYMITAHILKVTEITNSYSKELIYNLALKCNDIYLNVAINAKDLQGEPSVGRRFRGEIWLQGHVQI
ncbi:MAG: DUF3881 family protein [Lachnospiraceae bacterium]|nr:DUF3881 family protein [Lachnospiraceae bacterium]